MPKHFALRVRQTGRYVECVAERPSNPLSRCIGLLGRAALADHEAMWLDRTSAIHTCGMRYPIDVAFLDRAGKIVRLERSVPPWRLYVGALAASSVIEFASGSLARLGLHAGDTLEAEPLSQ